MTFIDSARLKFFDKDGDGFLSPAELAEAERVENLAKLPFKDFASLPDRERTAAENLFAARLLDRNVVRMERRRARLRAARRPAD